MREGLVDWLRARVEGEVRADEPLARHTTLKVGGPAAAYVVAESHRDLTAVAAACTRHARPCLVLGRGSNLLVADAGWPGIVVTLGRGFRGVDAGEAGRDGTVQVVVGAAEPMPVLAQRLASQGLGGLEFGVAIPGSVGGAVRMNAGAMGAEMANVLEQVEVARLGRGGELERLPADALQLGYRHSVLPHDAVVTTAFLSLHRADPERLRGSLRTYKQWRREHQPVNEPSCGSVFRNPPGDSAGRLIDAAGCKGRRIGGVTVNPVHANFFTVEPGARAGDVYELIREVQMAVVERHGVRLHPEVVLAGFDEAGAA